MEYEWFDNLEDFVLWQLNVNLAAQTPINREDVEIMFLETFPDTPTKKLTKKEMVNMLLENIGWRSIYDRYKNTHFGIKPSKWIDKFNLTQYQIKKMSTTGFMLFPIYTQYEKVFTGTYAHVQYYRAEEYFTTTVQDAENWKCNNIRGYKKEEV